MPLRSKQTSSFPLNASSSSPKKTDQLLELSFSGSLQNLQAAADDNTPSIPKIFLLANSGVPMHAGGFGEAVVVDFDHVSFDKNVTPVIADHDTGKRIGHTSAQAVVKYGEKKTIAGQEVVGPSIVAVGEVSSSSATAKEFTADAKSGFPFQVSIGAVVTKSKYVDDGESVRVNGQEYEGPLVVASETRVRELSVTVLGADSNTSAKVAASKQPSPKKVGDPMTFEEYLKGIFGNTPPTDEQKQALRASYDALHGGKPKTPSAPPADPPATSTNPEPLTASFSEQRKLQAAELKRTSGIQRLAAKFDRSGDELNAQVDGRDIKDINDLAAYAIENEWTVEAMELEIFRASKPVAPAAHIAPQIRDLDSRAITCALLKSSGKVPFRKRHEVTEEEYGLECWYPTEVLEASDHRELRNLSLHQIFDMQIIQANGLPYSGNRRSDDFLRATRQAMKKLEAAPSFTTHTATNIFDDAANKLLLAAYNGVNTTWQELAPVMSSSDFKTHNMYRMSFQGAYEQVGADGELKHGTLDDTKYTRSLDTYGKVFGLTRKQLINDDLGAFNALMTSMGVESAKSLEEVFYVTLLGQVGTMWTVGNKNLRTGAGSALTIDALDDAVQDFENQVEDNAPIGIEPDRILVGTALRVTASQLFSDTVFPRLPGDTGTGRESQLNPYTGAFRPIVSPYLNNTAILQRVSVASRGAAIPNQSATQWLMFANPNVPQGASFVVSLLNGNRTPVIEQFDQDFAFLGLRWQAYHDFGVDAVDYRLSHRSAGA